MKLESAALLMRLRRKPAFVSFGWLSFDKLVRLFAGVLVGTWMARQLGPAAYGQLAYVYAVVAMFGVLPALGLDSLFRRELVRAPERASDLLGTVFLLRLAMGGLSYALLAVLCVCTGIGRSIPSLMLIAGLTLSYPGFLVFDIWFQSRQTMRPAVVAQTTAFALATAVRIGALLLHADIEWLVLSLVLEVPLGAILLRRAFRRAGGRIASWRWHSGVAGALLRESWPLLLSAVAIVVYQKSDQVLMPSLAGNAETGRYAVAARILELWTFVPMALAAALAPALVRAKQVGSVEFSAEVGRILRRFTLAGWGLALGTAITAPVVVPLLFGRAYGNAAVVAAVLAFSQVFIAQGVARNEVLVAMGHTRFALFAAVVGAVVNVSLNLWWIPRAGALGAASASVVACAVAAVGTTFCWAPVRPLGRQQLAALWVWTMGGESRSTP